MRMPPRPSSARSSATGSVAERFTRNTDTTCEAASYVATPSTAGTGPCSAVSTIGTSSSNGTTVPLAWRAVSENGKNVV